MLRLALRFDCRARLGITTRHRAGLVRPGPETVDSLGTRVALRRGDDNRERGSRHHVVEQASLWARRILAFGGPASPRTRLDREYAFTSWLYASVNVFSCDPKAERCPSIQSHRKRRPLRVARFPPILSCVR